MKLLFHRHGTLFSRLKSVRTQASELGAIYNRQFKTKTNRENQTITVKRII